MSTQDTLIPRFPYTSTFSFGGVEMSAAEVISEMKAHLTPDRCVAIDRVVAARTFSIATVLDNLYDLGNIAAVMRSAESMGIQPMHIIRRQEKFKASKRITRGTDKWLDTSVWTEPELCIAKLKAQGYRIVATQLSSHAVSIDTLDFTIPTAIVFGNEHGGVAKDILEQADACCVIPMRGFAESLNISVAAAITFYHIVQDRMRRQGVHGDLDLEQIEVLRAEFYMRAHKRPKQLLSALLKRHV